MTALLLLGLAGFSSWPWGATPYSDPQGFLATLNAAAVPTTPAARPGPWWRPTSFGAWVWRPFWVPLLLLGLAWQAHRRGLDDLSWPQAAAALGVILASAGLLALGWPTVSWGSDLLYSGGTLGKNLAGAAALRSSTRAGAAPGPGPGPARQLHGGDPPVLRGPDSPGWARAWAASGANCGAGMSGSKRRSPPAPAGPNPRAR